MSLESRIHKDLAAIKAGLDDLRNSDTFTDTTLPEQNQTTTSNNNSAADNNINKDISQADELRRLKLINALLSDLSTCVDTIESNVSKVDEGLKVTNELIDKWAKILVKTSEISSLLLSEPHAAHGASDEEAEAEAETKWQGSTNDVSVYRKKVAQYNSLVNKYNGLKAAKEEQDKKARQREELRLRKIKEREQVLQKRVYGNKYRQRTRPQDTRSRIPKRD